MQSKTKSLIETLVNIGIGFIVSMFLTAWLFPTLTIGHNVQITAIFTVASIIRGYAVRRWFNRIE